MVSLKCDVEKLERTEKRTCRCCRLFKTGACMRLNPDYTEQEPLVNFRAEYSSRVFIREAMSDVGKIFFCI